MVEVLPHAAQSSPTGNRPTVHPSTDFIRAMLLAGRVAKLIDLAWLRSGAPQVIPFLSQHQTRKGFPFFAPMR